MGGSIPEEEKVSTVELESEGLGAESMLIPGLLASRDQAATEPLALLASLGFVTMLSVRVQAGLIWAGYAGIRDEISGARSSGGRGVWSWGGYDLKTVVGTSSVWTSVVVETSSSVWTSVVVVTPTFVSMDISVIVIGVLGQIVGLLLFSGILLFSEIVGVAEGMVEEVVNSGVGMMVLLSQILGVEDDKLVMFTVGGVTGKLEFADALGVGLVNTVKPVPEDTIVFPDGGMMGVSEAGESQVMLLDGLEIVEDG
jgi:hypothetical protein